MDALLLFAFALAILNGIVTGLNNCEKVKKHPELGIKPSKNLLTFLFTD